MSGPRCPSWACTRSVPGRGHLPSGPERAVPGLYATRYPTNGIWLLPPGTRLPSTRPATARLALPRALRPSAGLILVTFLLILADSGQVRCHALYIRFLILKALGGPWARKCQDSCNILGWFRCNFGVIPCNSDRFWMRLPGYRWAVWETVIFRVSAVYHTRNMSYSHSCLGIGAFRPRMSPFFLRNWWNSSKLEIFHTGLPSHLWPPEGGLSARNLSGMLQNWD